MRRLILLAVLVVGSAVASCEPNAPPPASVTVQGIRDEAQEVARRIRVDGLIEAREWANPDTVEVLLPDGRTITCLFQRGPESLDLAFLGLGGNQPRRIHPEVLLDVSGRFPSQFGRDTWWFRIAPTRCVAEGSADALECGIQLTGFEASPTPVDRQDNLEVRIAFSLLEYSPTSTPVVAFALRFAEDALIQDAAWPLEAELRRPDTWARLELGP